LFHQLENTLKFEHYLEILHQLSAMLQLFAVLVIINSLYFSPVILGTRNEQRLVGVRILNKTTLRSSLCHHQSWYGTLAADYATDKP